MIVKMSQRSSSPASPSRPETASRPQETVTPVSHTFGLSEMSASLEALNIEVERKPTIVHRAQASYSTGVSRDHQKSSQVSPRKPKRYALQIWLEVEVGPGYFVPPEDDSCTEDFALEALNRAYPGCTGVYLDRSGHMLAFYGRKGNSRAGLIQDVAIEAGRAVSEIPTWLGLTAKWKVRCVSVTEANDIIKGCKRLEKESRRQERLHYREQIASMHQPSNLSVTAPPFQPKAASSTPRLVTSGYEQGKSGMKVDPTPSHYRTDSPAERTLSQVRGSPPHDPDGGDETSDGDLVDFASRRRGRRSRGNRSHRGSGSSDSSDNSRFSRSTGEGGRRRKKDGFSNKIQIPEFEGNTAMQAMSPMLSGSGLGASPIIETTMKTRI